MRAVRRVLSAALHSKLLNPDRKPVLGVYFQNHRDKMLNLATGKSSERLGGKVAIITGGANGIGQAIASLFAREAATVVVADIDEPKGSAVVKKITAGGGLGVFLRTDVTSDNDVRETVRRTLELYGRIDVLVNNVGVNVQGGIVNLSPEQWHQGLEMNLTSVFRCSRLIVPEMINRGGGSVIIMASVQAVAGFWDSSGYAAAKGGLVSLTRQLARQFADQRLRVNSICPGVVLTPIFSAGENTDKMFDAVSSYTPLGHVGVPEDIAFASLFLASDESSFITGTNMVVDGGMTMRGV